MAGEKPFDLRERLVSISKRAIRICKRLPSTPEGLRIRDQLSGSVTSIGANYEEADGTYSQKDFLNKLVLARKEAREAKFFFRTIDGVYSEENAFSEEIQELDEIVRILSKKIQLTSRHINKN